MKDAIVAQLSELGMTRNEAQAYLTLLEGSEEGSTGYDVAARGGIPRSAVYTVLRRLEEAGAAFSTGDKPARFVPVSPKQLVEHMRESSAQRLAGLEQSLGTVRERAWPEPVWIFRDYEQVLAEVDRLLRRAEGSVYLSLWAREVARLRPALDQVAKRGREAVLYCPDGVAALPGFDCWSEDLDDVGKAAWSHRALVVVDHRTALIGGTEPGADNQAVLTRNPSLVNVATDNIILDITRLAARLGRDPEATVSRMMRPHFA